MGSRRDVSELVLFDILLYLPVMSLLRFKTICKSWCSIIESSSFIGQHLYHNSRKNSLIVRSYEGQLFMICGRKHELCSNLDFECIYPKDKLIRISSCNGIVCLGFILSNYYWRISLWNPATKQMRELPESSYLCCKSSRALTYHTFALGFDKKTNDYKIVSLSLETETTDEELLLKGSLVQIYNMRTDSWRTVQEGDDFPIVWFNEEVVCNGETCLCIGEVADNLFALFYFDLIDEVYGTVPLPKDPYETGDQFPAFLNDKIAYIDWTRETSSCCYYEIWMMNELGVKESWNKVYRLKEPILPCHGTSQLYLSNNGDFILAGKNIGYKYELYLYDLVTGEVKYVGVQKVGSIINYNESLVSIKSRDQE